MNTEYLSAPLPFVGQKRMFAQKFKEVLKEYPDNSVFVDLFGGSGLLSHITKREKPNATVIYNDYDNYRMRLNNINRTNALLSDLRKLTIDCPRQKLIPEPIRGLILERLRQEETTGFVDYITISSSLLFSMKYCMNLKDLQRESFYNNIRKQDYPLCTDYLNGLEIVSCDYKELVKKYKNLPNVVFLVDPPYLSTEVGTYRMNWRLSDYLDVLSILVDKSFIYFTSNKSSILELCCWMGNHPNIGNPFNNAKKEEFNARMNYNSTYTDVMLYKKEFI
ncbi:DNA adenine methylase [Phocaeicola plebeius]|jgi:adenine-specific DNA methylase|uniref:DNA adenine methylase n=2 Tax=Phocaeicola plebeius TaxID=310297 RepID=UPI0022E35551|nr:DNA adenine methylase [Phocaeicola plebeius]MBS4827036.1 DNA adenine methylase [Bacteroides sp.]CAJ1771817.1 DNA methyltransferase [uncultured phage]